MIACFLNEILDMLLDINYIEFLIWCLIKKQVVFLEIKLI